MTERLLSRLVIGMAVVVCVIGADARSGALTARTRFPIHWRVGKIDPRFGVDSSEVKQAAERAIHVWEAEAGRRLFVYDGKQGFPVDLVFDTRQAAGNWRHNDQQRLAAAKSDLQRLERSARDAMDRYRRAAAQVDAVSESYESKLDAYDRRVEHWNRRGGAPPNVVDTLEAERANLASERSRVERDQREMEALLAEANRCADEYNYRVSTYNAAVEGFNGRSSSSMVVRTGECLSLGSKPKRISIFAFQDTNHLTAVLAHEFGHAIGLRHVRGDGALMSAVESGDGLAFDLRLTDRDRAELRRALQK